MWTPMCSSRTPAYYSSTSALGAQTLSIVQLTQENGYLLLATPDGEVSCQLGQRSLSTLAAGLGPFSGRVQAAVKLLGLEFCAWEGTRSQSPLTGKIMPGRSSREQCRATFSWRWLDYFAWPDGAESKAPNSSTRAGVDALRTVRDFEIVCAGMWRFPWLSTDGVAVGSFGERPPATAFCILIECEGYKATCEK